MAIHRYPNVMRFLFVRIPLALVSIAALVSCTTYTYPTVEVDRQSMKATVTQLCDIAPPRSNMNIASLEKAADLVRSKFESIGYTCTDQDCSLRNFESGHERKYRNILTSIGPESAPRYVVGAHYDVCGNQAGADDNASGVAGLIELARLMKQHENQLKYRIDFVAYTMEEPPFFGTAMMGSYVHAKSLSDADVDVKGMIVLEMIGYFLEKKQKYPLGIMSWFYPAKGNFIAVVSAFSDWGLNNDVRRGLRGTDCPVTSLKAPAWVQGIDFSDHRNYWKFGYDAVMVTDTAFYRNNHYHQPTDTPDTLDYGKMAEVVKGTYWMLYNETVDAQ